MFLQWCPVVAPRKSNKAKVDVFLIWLFHFSGALVPVLEFRRKHTTLMSEPTRTRRGLETIQVCPGVHLEYLDLCLSSPRPVRLKAGRLSLFRVRVTNDVVVYQKGELYI